jgi:hypothetical protein
MGSFVQHAHQMKLYWIASINAWLYEDANNEMFINNVFGIVKDSQHSRYFRMFKKIFKYI